MGLGRNVGALIAARGLTVSEVARGIGLDGSQALHVLIQRDSQKSQFASKLAGYFGVPLDRLLAEDFDPAGLAAKEERAGYGLAPVRTWEHETDLPPGEYAFIPRLDVHLSAGSGREHRDVQVEIEFVKSQPQAFRADWIRKMRLKPSKLAVMHVTGDSMEDRLHEGDAVVIDTSQTEIVDGKVYALWYDGGERVKRLYRLPGGGLVIRSDNESRHPPLTISAGDSTLVRIIGRVVHVSGEGGL